MMHQHISSVHRRDREQVLDHLVLRLGSVCLLDIPGGPGLILLISGFIPLFPVLVTQTNHCPLRNHLFSAQLLGTWDYESFLQKLYFVSSHYSHKKANMLFTRSEKRCAYLVALTCFIAYALGLMCDLDSSHQPASTYHVGHDTNNRPPTTGQEQPIRNNRSGTTDQEQPIRNHRSLPEHHRLGTW